MNVLTRFTQITALFAMVASVACGSAPTAPEASVPAPTAAHMAYATQSFMLDGRAAYVLEPASPRSDRAWIWLAPSNMVNNETDMQYITHFLDQGFAVAGIEIGTSCGSLPGVAMFDDFYLQMVATSHSSRVRFLAQSNGGLMAYAWAFRHPSEVDRIGGIYPATDLRSWPGLPAVLTLPSVGVGYGLTLGELTARLLEFNPISNLRPLAQAGVRIYHFAGDIDKVVDVNANSVNLVDEYARMGGVAALEIRPGLGHYAYGSTRTHCWPSWRPLRVRRGRRCACR